MNPSSFRTTPARAFFLLVLALSLIGPGSLQALIVMDGYNANLHNRFDDWENADANPNNNYAVNPSVSVSSLTGLGWGPGFGGSTDLTYAAITNQHVIGGHVGLALNTTLYFHGDGGSIISRTVSAATSLGNDLWLYTLSSPITESTFAPIPIFIPGNPTSFSSMTIAMFGQNGRVVIDNLAPYTQAGPNLINSPLASYNPSTQSITLTNTFEVAAGNTVVGHIPGAEGKYEANDSNDAVLGLYNGQWGLLGTAYLTANGNTGPSFFNMLAAYYQSLPPGVNATFIAVPEPGRICLLLIGIGTFLLRRRR